MKKKNIRIKIKLLFLRKLFIKRSRFLNRKNLMFNYFFYRSFLNFYKNRKQRYLYNLYFKDRNNLKYFFPEFTFSKNVFNKKIKFKDISLKHNFEYIFIPKKLSKSEFGLNYYSKVNVKNELNYKNFIKFLQEDENKGLLASKDCDENLINSLYISNIVNVNFNFNLIIFQNLELYKIIIVLYLNKLNKKYI